MKKLLICKDELKGELITTQVLEETENIKYVIIENPPEIQTREGEIGKYVWDEETDTIKVVYNLIPKTQLDLIQEQLDHITKTTEFMAREAFVNGLVTLENNQYREDQ